MSAEALTFVEVDFDYCTRSYGVAPCNARLASANDPVAVTFDGVDDYLTRGAGLTGASDSKLLTISFWIRPGLALTLQRLFSAATGVGGATVRLRLSQAADNSILLIAENSAATEILRIASSALTVGRLYHVLISVDLSNTAKRHIYVNDVSDLATVTTYTNDTIDLTHADWAVGGVADGSGLFTGELADLWVNFGGYLDLSVTANRRLFIDGSGNPASLGATGNTPTGAAPIVFMSGAVNAWHTNKGTGGGMTLHGALVEGDFATADAKCFNTRATCQDRANFNLETQGLRFAKPSAYLPRDIDALPTIKQIDYSPSRIAAGENLGQRASVKVTFFDHRHGDGYPGLDKYLADRGYDPWSRGSFWPRFRARHPYLRTFGLRLIHGFVGQSLAEMETRHFFIESIDGPTPDGLFSIIAKDALKFLDGDRAQAPALSNGFLASDVNSSTTTWTLSPSGIGNAEYPAVSGSSPEVYVCGGGNEVVRITGRSGDTLTVTRAQFNTTAVAHSAGDRVQLCLRYSAQRPDAIIADLIEDYTDLDPAYIDNATWQTEVETYLNRVYTALITEPTPVAKLVNELIEQAALALWDDNIAEQLRLQVLRPIVTEAAEFSDSNILRDTFKAQEHPEKQVTQVWVYFGQINPTKNLDDLDNFRCIATAPDDADIDLAEENLGQSVIRKVRSRWIPAVGGVDIAERAGEIIFGRYQSPPRTFNFEVLRNVTGGASGAAALPELGGGYQVNWWSLQDESGSREDVPVQVSRLVPTEATIRVEAEEFRMLAVPEDPDVHDITINVNTSNVNARTLHDSLYAAPTNSTTINITITAGTTVGSTSTALKALDIGDWSDVPLATINLIVEGTIQGCGGQGGAGGTGGGAGAVGGVGGIALYLRRTVALSGTGTISGGGGGGGGGGSTGVSRGGGGGGGGAGSSVGAGGSGGFGSVQSGSAGSNGTASGGGAGGAGAVTAGNGGAGGAPGQNGSAGAASGVGGAGGSAGSAGSAIDGDSYTSGGGSLTISGPQVN